LGQRGETEYGWNGEVYAARARAFGWHAIQLDGHDYQQIDRAFQEALDYSDGPVVLVAKTVKGKGVPAIENINGWHGKALPPADAEGAIQALGGKTDLTVDVHEPPAASPTKPKMNGALQLPRY